MGLIDSFYSPLSINFLIMTHKCSALHSAGPGPNVTVTVNKTEIVTNCGTICSLYKKDNSSTKGIQ